MTNDGTKTFPENNRRSICQIFLPIFERFLQYEVKSLLNHIKQVYFSKFPIRGENRILEYSFVNLENQTFEYLRDLILKDDSNLPEGSNFKANSEESNRQVTRDSHNLEISTTWASNFEKWF